MGHRWPVDAVRRHDRSFNANPSKVDRAVVLADRGDATEACTEAACHVVFERDIAGDAMSRDELCQGGEHGAAARSQRPSQAFHLAARRRASNSVTKP